MSQTNNNKKNQSPDLDLASWRNKFQELVNTAQEEIKRTTAIGKRMISASKSNTSLHDAYEALGQLTEKAIVSGELKWDNEKVKEMLEGIKELKEELNKFEDDVRKIKTSGQD